MTEPTTKQPAQEVPTFRHVLPLQIRWNDTDKFGHVNNGVFFEFYDTAKTDYMTTVCPGVDWEQVGIVVVHIEADFVAEVKAGHHILARTRTSHIGRTSIRLEQEILDSDTQQVKCRCTSVMVLYDLHEHQTIPLPDEWVQAICAYEQNYQLRQI
ncbi:MAG: acyl-CoA thioesterase [Prevotella sp.]|nr:acyl-CoA thioesterase [Prevotella sp.]